MIAVPVQASELTIPDTTVLTDEEFALPILTSDLTGLSVFGYDGKILYDTTFIRYVGIDKRGTLSAKLLVVPNPNVLGEIRLAAASADSIFGKGVLLYLLFASKKSIGESSVTFDSFNFSANVDSSERYPAFRNGRVTVKPIVTSINDGDEIVQTSISQVYPYPNPFNGVLTIDYYVPVYNKVEIVIYDLLGRKIRTLMNEMSGTGYYKVQWDGSSDSNLSLPSGMYICRIRIAGKDKSYKISFIK